MFSCCLVGFVVGFPFDPRVKLFGHLKTAIGQPGRYDGFLVRWEVEPV